MQEITLYEFSTKKVTINDKKEINVYIDEQKAENSIFETSKIIMKLLKNDNELIDLVISFEKFQDLKVRKKILLEVAKAIEKRAREINELHRINRLLNGM